MKFELEIINDEPMISSLKIAEVFGRPHRSVLTSIRDNLGLQEIVQSSYINSQNKEQPMIYLSERSALIAMPFIGGEKSKEGQIALVDAYLAYRNSRPPQSFAQALRLAADKQEALEKLEEIRKLEAPKVQFAEYVISKDEHLNIGTYAKALSKEYDIEIGQNKLFDYLRARKFLQTGRDASERNLPYQKYIANGYFTVKTKMKYANSNIKIYTTQITGKGQFELSGDIVEYFSALTKN